MQYWTYQAIKEKVESDLDLKDESFITPEELMGYCNEAIDDAESEIHAIYEDYFLNSETLALTEGQSEYSLPSDIFANKIRAVIYSNGSINYPVKRIRDSRKFYTLALINQFGQADDYCYILKNPSAATGMKLVLYPASRETSSNNVTIWYIRNANRITSESDVCDIPEFVNFVIQFMKVRCYEKESHPNLAMAIGALEKQRKLMVDTLTEMVPDSDNTIEMDLSFYQNFDQNFID